MLRTLPESLQQKLQPRMVTGMPGDSLRRQAQEQVNSGNVNGAIATLRQGVSRYPDDPWMRLDLARLLQNPAMTARPRRDGRRVSPRRQQ
jgi:outer membrane protein assembly factor BamD (BamD/ComL family)